MRIVRTMTATDSPARPETDRMGIEPRRPALGPPDRPAKPQTTIRSNAASPPQASGGGGGGDAPKPPFDTRYNVGLDLSKSGCAVARTASVPRELPGGGPRMMTLVLVQHAGNGVGLAECGDRGDGPEGRGGDSLQGSDCQGG